MNRTMLAVVSLVVLPVLAHAECGWLLMTPRSVGPNVQLPPVSEWQQDSGHDSARECQAALDGALQSYWKRLGERYATETLPERVRRGEYGKLTPDERMSIGFLLGRCLPASQVPIR